MRNNTSNKVAYRAATQPVYAVAVRIIPGASHQINDIINQLNKEAMKTYNGHRSWNAWNVSLWINNDEPLYRFAQDCMKRTKNNAGFAARLFMRDMQGCKSPDGATYTHLAVKLAIQDINS